MIIVPGVETPGFIPPPFQGEHQKPIPVKGLGEGEHRYIYINSYF
jgi:hypothetical protein